MTKIPRKRIDPKAIDVSKLELGPDIDLETEVVLDSGGNRIDQAWVDRVVAEFDQSSRDQD